MVSVWDLVWYPGWKYCTGAPADWPGISEPGSIAKLDLYISSLLMSPIGRRKMAMRRLKIINKMKTRKQSQC